VRRIPVMGHVAHPSVQTGGGADDTLCDSMLVYLVGAPGSGKSTLVSHLRRRLADWVVLDWDFLLERSSTLAGSDIRDTPSLWATYDELVLAAVTEISDSGVNCTVAGVRTPSELPRWPINVWILLDCSDSIRSARLTADGRAADIYTAVSDAAKYRSLGLTTVDTSAPPEDVARQLEELIGRADARLREI
jgi:thymidylate kinase